MASESMAIEPEVKRRSIYPVLFAGGLTTALALGGNYFLGVATDGEHDVMGLYANLIIPVGPLIVGLVAGIGYGVMSWLTGVKITGKLLWMVVLCQFLAYVLAQWLSFQPLIRMAREAGLDISFQDSLRAFVAWFDEVTRSFEMIDQGKEATGVGMGAWGYGIRFLEVVGFVGGGVVVPAITKTAPYCDRCQVYKKQKSIGLLPAGCKQRKVGKKDEAGQAAYAAEHQAGLEAAMAQLDEIRQWAEEGRVSDLKRLVEKYREKEAAKEVNQQTTRLELKIQRCPNCHTGTLQAQLVSGDAGQPNIEDLGKSPASAALETELG